MDDRDGLNQCDGCKKGDPIINGIHINIVTDRGYMVCQKSKYADDLRKESPRPLTHAMTAVIEAARQDIIDFAKASMFEDCAALIEEHLDSDTIQRNIGHALLAQPAAVEPVSRQNQINRLTRERDGWKETCDDLTKALHIAQCDLDVALKHQKNDVWYWQGDGEDHPESMNSRMVVVIHAGDLNALLAQQSAASDVRDAVWLPRDSAPFDVDLLVFGPNCYIGRGYRSKQYETIWTHWKPLPSTPAVQAGKGDAS